jgi:hypothetical protein
MNQMNRLQSGLAASLGVLPWNLTPIMGLVTDTLPLPGCRHRTYLAAIGITGTRNALWNAHS